MIRKLYDWMMRNAKGRNAWGALAGFTFAEASFFPIPTDIMLIPMVMADRERAWLLGAWCTLWSVLGGIFGYAIGYFLFESLGQWLISIYGMAHSMESFHDWYAKYGAWVILIKGASPIPYKLVTIASGFAQYSFVLFVLLSIVTRGARFMLVAGLLKWKGEQARLFIEKRLEASLLVFLGVVIAGVVAVKYLF
ncbi:MAG: DedA family protein [Rubrivivax sp.]|nr:MAG: DedA family protein [Rubrivivax sp.]